MATPNVIREDAIAPISSDRPAGEELTGSLDWIEIRNLRPNVWDAGEKREWERAGGGKASWSLFKRSVAEALATKSKDLRLAVWLLEASTKEDGFAGTRDGIRLINDLLMRFWDRGLFPEIDDGDLETRFGPLEWLNEKLAEAVREIPVTMRPAPGVNYSWKYFQESRRPGGLITAEEFDRAAAVGSLEQYTNLQEDFDGAWKELLEFDRIAGQLFGSDSISVTEAREAFEDCRQVIDRILRKRPVPPVPAQNENTGDRASPPGHWIEPVKRSLQGHQDSAWATAEQLARRGEIDQALAEMTALANVEPNGRARFHRKLLLAEICLNTQRTRLAKTILEELAELVDHHHLEQWETSELVASVWTKLYRCYVDGNHGMADSEHAGRLFERLCRLNPWQALTCAERSSR